jgi:hypothetical protein
MMRGHTFSSAMLTAGCWMLLAANLSAANLSASPWDKYVWETVRTTGISPACSNLITELRAEMEKILQAGALAPVRTVYADLEQDPYFMYWQGGRIITTLAMAWPHLTSMQQKAVKEYVRAEMLQEQRSPWSMKGFIPPESGSRRELHTFHEGRGWERYWNMWGRNKPIMGSFYGLWLYGERTADWNTLQEHYPQIAALYSRKAGECNLYGTMGAHIAMARMARHFGDAAMETMAVSNAAAAFRIGTNFAAVESATKRYWKERYEPRQRGGVYQGWMFLDLCPEVGRYLSDHVKDAVLQRDEEGLKKYPFFWLREVPYDSRWTGDEGLGIPTELMGMIVPIERWVAGASFNKLSGYLRSTPICVGDCYWLEALVQAIEASGSTEWVQVSP